MTKVAIITAICGNVAKLHTPNNIFKDVDYFAFVDKPQKCEGWTQLPALDFSLDSLYRNRRNAKIYKIMPHLFFPDYNYWIWHDPTHEVIENPLEFCEQYLHNKDLGVFKHTHRTCIYEEASELLKLKYDLPENIHRQMDYYRSQCYPKNNGLYELPTFIRKNTDKIKVLNLRWWEQICKYSSRDQLSLPFVAWKTAVSICTLPGYANGGLHKNKLIPQIRTKS